MLMAAVSPARALEVVVSPAAPTACDSVTITVNGLLPNSCYQVIGATIRGPYSYPCMTPGPCPSSFSVDVALRENAPDPAVLCSAFPVPYSRSFHVGRLTWGDWGVHATERTFQYSQGDSDSIPTTVTAQASFLVSPDTTCVLSGLGCYILSFSSVEAGVGPLVDPNPLCTVTTLPGGTACLALDLTNSTSVAGVQTALDIASNLPLDSSHFLHAISVEAIGRASGFSVGWTPDGQRTKLILYSTSGALLPTGSGPVARICYAVAPETPPATFAVFADNAIVADSLGNGLPPCPTFARVPPGRICVGGAGCDLNSDGIADVLDIIHLVHCALAPGDSLLCPPAVAAHGDCNADGTLDVRDVVCCVHKILEGPIASDAANGATGAPSASGAIGFEESSVRLDSDGRGTVDVAIRAGSDFGGIQFLVDPRGAPLRIRDVHADLPASDRIEWHVDDTGIAHVMLYAAALGARSEETVKVQLEVESTSDEPWGTLRLDGVRLGRADGSAANAGLGRVAVDVSGAQAAPALLGSRPNPFASSTEIGFALPRDARVTLRVYDTAGRLVRTLVDGPRSAGLGRAVWDGTDGRGRLVPAGIYFTRLEANGIRRSGRLLLLR